MVTNHHVIAGQARIKVTLHDGKSHPAHLIGEDTLLDIAVLKIDTDETFTPLKLGDSSLAQVGQIVFAVGNPFGFGETVTPGHHFRQRTLPIRQPARPVPNRRRHQPRKLRWPACQPARRDHWHQRRHLFAGQTKPGFPGCRVLDSRERRQGLAVPDSRARQAHPRLSGSGNARHGSQRPGRTPIRWR